VPAFVKMHEIAIMDDDLDEATASHFIRDFENGLYEIFEYLEMMQSFKLSKGRKKGNYVIQRIPDSEIPQWMVDIETPPTIPEGVFECPHCGRRFPTDIQLSMHQKIHYLV